LNWKTAADATQAIWQDPSSYDPYTQGPPYLPESPSRRTASQKVSSEFGLPEALAALRALAMVHQTHHWLTSGPAFYADHLLFERLYADTMLGEWREAQKREAAERAEMLRMLAARSTPAAMPAAPPPAPTALRDVPPSPEARGPSPANGAAWPPQS
jgi:hypothetical protein